MTNQSVIYISKNSAVKRAAGCEMSGKYSLGYGPRCSAFQTKK